MLSLQRALWALFCMARCAPRPWRSKSPVGIGSGAIAGHLFTPPLPKNRRSVAGNMAFLKNFASFIRQ